MNGAAPLSPQGPLNLAALRLVEASPNLAATLGTQATAEILATLLEAGPEGLLLQLEDGRKLKAAGDLPYAPGTTFTFRVQSPGEGLLQLQPLRAEPPVTPPLLAPLLQGEAADLLQRLAAPQVEPRLAALRELLQALQPALPPETEALLATFRSALPEGGARSPGADLAKLLRASGWPAPAAEAWARFLGAAPSPSAPGTPAPAEAIPRPTAALLRALGLPETLATALEAGPAEAPPEALLRARDLLARLPAPLAQRALALLTLLPAAAQGTAPAPLPADHPLARLVQTLLPELRSAFVSAQPGGPPPALPADPGNPATWAGWMKGVMETLGRTESSPAQAPAHALQAREGTALFQMPLPWGPASGHLEIWAEREPGSPGAEPVHRVLLALSFQAAGELRVGLQSGPGGLRAQVLAQGDRAAALEAALRTELGTPAPFPVKVRALPALPPGPLTQALGGLEALG